MSAELATRLSARLGSGTGVAVRSRKAYLQRSGVELVPRLADFKLVAEVYYRGAFVVSVPGSMAGPALVAMVYRQVAEFLTQGADRADAGPEEE